MQTLSKKTKRLLRDCLGEAYERELHRELSKLDESFAEWRNGTICSSELEQRIHKFHNGPARELYKRYNYGQAELTVAYTIVVGVLPEETVPAELLEALGASIDYYRSLRDQGELREPDDWSR